MGGAILCERRVRVQGSDMGSAQDPLFRQWASQRRVHVQGSDMGPLRIRCLTVEYSEAELILFAAPKRMWQLRGFGDLKADPHRSQLLCGYFQILLLFQLLLLLSDSSTISTTSTTFRFFYYFSFYYYFQILQINSFYIYALQLSFSFQHSHQWRSQGVAGGGRGHPPLSLGHPIGHPWQNAPPSKNRAGSRW